MIYGVGCRVAPRGFVIFAVEALRHSPGSWVNASTRIRFVSAGSQDKRGHGHAQDDCSGLSALVFRLFKLHSFLPHQSPTDMTPATRLSKTNRRRRLYQADSFIQGLYNCIQRLHLIIGIVAKKMEYFRETQLVLAQHGRQFPLRKSKVLAMTRREEDLAVLIRGCPKLLITTYPSMSRCNTL
jgi:hypothetical protein